ncbi:unnamed protein product [Mortierella alpina]
MSIVSSTALRPSTQPRRVVGVSTSARSKVHFTVSPNTTTTTLSTTTVCQGRIMPSSFKDITSRPLLQSSSSPKSSTNTTTTTTTTTATTTTSGSTVRSSTSTWPTPQQPKALQDAHPAPSRHNGFLTRGSGRCGAFATPLHSLPASLLQQRLLQPKEHLAKSQDEERLQFLRTQEHIARHHQALSSLLCAC